MLRPSKLNRVRRVCTNFCRRSIRPCCSGIVTLKSSWLLTGKPLRRSSCRMNFPSPRPSTADHLRKSSFFLLVADHVVVVLISYWPDVRVMDVLPPLVLHSFTCLRIMISKVSGVEDWHSLCKIKDALALHAVGPTATHGALPPPFQILFALHWFFIFYGFALLPFFCQQPGTRRSFSSICTHTVKQLTSFS